MTDILPNPHVALNNARAEGRAEAPIGAVLERPEGELLLLWRVYAALLDKHARLQKENRKLRKQSGAS